MNITRIIEALGVPLSEFFADLDKPTKGRSGAKESSAAIYRALRSQ